MLHPFWSRSLIAFTCAPTSDSVPALGGQSDVQAVINISCMRDLPGLPLSFSL